MYVFDKIFVFMKNKIKGKKGAAVGTKCMARLIEERIDRLDNESDINDCN